MAFEMRTKDDKFIAAVMNNDGPPRVGDYIELTADKTSTYRVLTVKHFVSATPGQDFIMTKKTVVYVDNVE